MGNGNNDVGSNTPTRKTGQLKTGQPMAQMSGTGASGKRIDQQMQAAQPKNCGAMSQQGSFSFHGNEAAPQKLVRLVGCHASETPEPLVREAWVRRRSEQR